MSAYDALKGEIRRLARKEAKALVESANASSKAARKQVAELKQAVIALRRELSDLKRVVGASNKSRVEAKAAPSRERITARGIVSLRSRLGISQSELGLLCGVSSAGVSHWEAERAHPKDKALGVLLELRKLGKKEVAKRLAEIAG